jgi:hypothetical protein
MGWIDILIPNTAIYIVILLEGDEIAKNKLQKNIQKRGRVRQ